MAGEPAQLSVEMAVSTWLSKPLSPTDDIVTRSHPDGISAPALAAVSFSAHPRPLSLPPPVPPVSPVPQRPRRTAAAALRTAILQFLKTRNPRFHKPGETERLRSCSRPASCAGCCPIASHGGHGGRGKAEASGRLRAARWP